MDASRISREIRGATRRYTYKHGRHLQSAAGAYAFSNWYPAEARSARQGVAGALRREGKAAVGKGVDQAVGDQAVQGSGALNGVRPDGVQAGLGYRLF